MNTLWKICLNGMEKTAKLTFTSQSYPTMLTILMEKEDMLLTKSIKMLRVMNPGVQEFTPTSETIKFQ